MDNNNLSSMLIDLTSNFTDVIDTSISQKGIKKMIKTGKLSKRKRIRNKQIKKLDVWPGILSLAVMVGATAYIFRKLRNNLK